MKKETKMQTSRMKIVTILPEGYSGNTEGYSSNAEEPSNKAGGRFIRKTVQYASADSSGMYKT